MPFGVWVILPSLCLRFMHAIVGIRISFLLLNIIPLCVCAMFCHLFLC